MKNDRFASFNSQDSTLKKTFHIIKANWPAYVFVLSFFFSGLITLPEYGMSWDEGLGNFFFGERYFYYFTTFKGKYLDFNADLAGLRNQPLKLFASPYRQRPFEFPPVADTIAAAGMHIFSYKLHWIDPVDAFHATAIFFAAGLLLFLYAFIAPRLGRFTALLSIIFLGTFPRFWGDMHINVKDVPEAVLFSLTLMAYLVWFEKPRFTTALLTGVLFGCALGVKANALYIPLILVLGTWPLFSINGIGQTIKHLAQNYLHYLLMVMSGILTYLASWPYLFANWKRVFEYFQYIYSQGGRQGGPGWNWQPLQMVTATMPEVMLVFFLIGLVWVVNRTLRGKSPLWRLLLVWCLLPIILISMPHMVNFDGIRHFLEFVPAAAVIAAVGASKFVRWIIAKHPNRRLLAHGIVLGLIFLNVAQITINYYPYEYIYFNGLVGGISKAGNFFKSGEATDYWAVSYRQGMQWLDQNAEQHARLYVPVANWLVQLTGPLWLRSDIEVVSPQDVAEIHTSDTPVYVMFITRPDFYDKVAQDCLQNLKPVHQVLVDHVPILLIYRLPPQNE
jgi:hypothetical protein